MEPDHDGEGGSSPDWATYWLCDLGEVISPVALRDVCGTYQAQAGSPAQKACLLPDPVGIVPDGGMQTQIPSPGSCSLVWWRK
jgi:hypothetical protein